MALLTREERRHLSKGERRALRKERRGERREDRDQEKWGAALARAEDLLVELSGECTVDQALDEVVSILAEEADELLDWKWLANTGAVGMALAVALEAADGPVAAALLGWLVRKPLKRLWARLKDQGLLEEVASG